MGIYMLSLSLELEQKTVDTDTESVYNNCMNDIPMTDKDKVYSCISCRHFRMHPVKRALALVGLGTYSLAECDHSARTERFYDPVTGRIKTQQHRELCSVYRSDVQNYCGAGAQYWLPKSGRDLFKFLKKS